MNFSDLSLTDEAQVPPFVQVALAPQDNHPLIWQQFSGLLATQAQLRQAYLHRQTLPV